MSEEDMPIFDLEPVELPFENMPSRYLEFYRGVFALDKEVKEPEWKADNS